MEMEEAPSSWSSPSSPSWPRRGKGSGSAVAVLEGYVEQEGPDPATGDGGGSAAVGRTKSLTDEDLEDLKGCLDLGFGFNYDEIPELCATLPALELCYSLSRLRSSRSHDEQASPPAAAIADWKISSPGDDPDEVKARLRYWATAVACTVRLCN